MATALVDIGTLITSTPGVRGGRPYVIGAGVTVRRIIGRIYKENLTPEQLADDMPHLSLAGVYAALAYYHANQVQLDLHGITYGVAQARLLPRWHRIMPAESLFNRRANAPSPRKHKHFIRPGYPRSGAIP